MRIETGDDLVVRAQNDNSHLPFNAAIGDPVKVQFAAGDARILTN